MPVGRNCDWCYNATLATSLEFEPAFCSRWVGGQLVGATFPLNGVSSVQARKHFAIRPLAGKSQTSRAARQHMGKPVKRVIIDITGHKSREVTSSAERKKQGREEAGSAGHGSVGQGRSGQVGRAVQRLLYANG